MPGQRKRWASFFLSGQVRVQVNRGESSFFFCRRRKKNKTTEIVAVVCTREFLILREPSGARSVDLFLFLVFG